MRFNALIAFLTTLFATAALAAPSPYPALRKDLQPLIKKLSRQIYVYHWVSREDMHGSNAHEYLHEKILEFWNPDLAPTGQVGNGLYAATDPVSSRGYGKNNWVLFSIPLYRDLVFFDLRNTSGLALSEGARSELQSKNCSAKNVRELFGTVQKDLSCSRVLQTVLNRLWIQAIIYPYPVTQLKGCDTQRAQASFVITDPSISVGEFEVYTPGTPDSKGIEELEKLMIQETFRRASYPKSWWLWPGWKSAPSPEQADTWLASKVFGCKNDFPEEMEPREYQISDEAFRDRAKAVQLRALAISQRLGFSLEPYSLKDFSARRFINRRDWESYLKSGIWDSQVPADPREVYEPKPLTWENWEKVARTEVLLAADQGTPLTLELLSRWNLDAIRGTVSADIHGGELKATPNYGANLSRTQAVTGDEVAALLEIKLPLQSEHPLHWTSLVCREELPKELDLIDSPLKSCQEIYKQARALSGTVNDRDGFWKQTLLDLGNDRLYDSQSSNKWYWYACWPRLMKHPKQRVPHSFCGMIRYPAPETVPGTLQAILQNINDRVSAAGPGAVAFHEDALSFALKIQREIVALHPFNKGNGRVSRWIMDYLAIREGMAPILIDNMDLDLTTPESRYLEQGRNGEEFGLRIIEKCLDLYERLAPGDGVGLAKLAAGRCGMLQGPKSPD